MTPPQTPQDEDTPHNPVTLYGVSKLAATFSRDSIGGDTACTSLSGILFNHELPPEAGPFRHAKDRAGGGLKISLGRSEEIETRVHRCPGGTGGTRAIRSRDWLMLQKPAPADYVLATGETHSIRDYLQVALTMLGCAGEDWVETDPALVRPVDVGRLVGNPSRARNSSDGSLRSVSPGWCASIGRHAIATVEVPALNADPSAPNEVEVFPDRSLLSIDRRSLSPPLPKRT